MTKRRKELRSPLSFSVTKEGGMKGDVTYCIQCCGRIVFCQFERFLSGGMIGSP